MHIFKYSFLSIFRKKSLIFWPLVFPILLGTLFKLAFGDLESANRFSKIPAAVCVTESGGSEYAVSLFDGLSTGENALLSVNYMPPDAAEKMLADGKVDGIFTVDGVSLTLTISRLNETDGGINQSILKSISDGYLQTVSTVKNIAEKSPENLASTLKSLTEPSERILKTSNVHTNFTSVYFYALLAMASLFGCYLGSAKALENRGDISARAARLGCCPRSKIKLILCDFAAALAVHFLEVMIVIGYVVFVLGIDFGDSIPLIILTSFMGCAVGVSFGMFFTSFVKANAKTIEGMLTGISLFMCFLSGLMVGNMKHVIEKNAPAINRINPAALLSDAYYCLAVYDNYTKYTRVMLTLAAFAAFFFIASAMILRRQQYDSI